MRSILIICVGIVILIFSGFIYTYTSDVVAISSIELAMQKINATNQTLTNVTLIIQMNLSNPTYRTIRGLSSIFDIYIGQYLIGSGNFQNININSKSYTIHSVNTVITYKGLAHSVIDIITNIIEGKQTMINIKGTMTSKIFFGLSQTTQKFSATITTS